ncbi:class I SAM-dependent methyltransferase [Leptospira sp. 96542]|nr:class I SAM-dependent methyltransferase [Leptospira sp. 96542]
MKPSKIANAYDQLFHLSISENFNQNNGINQHKRAIAFSKKKTNANVLDVGCGCNGRLIELLLSEGFYVEGVDISEKMITLVREKFKNQTFYHADICEWTIPKKYDFITAWDSIWHIPLNEQIKVMSKLVGALNQNGILIFSCGGTEKASEHYDASMGEEVYYSTLGINGFLELMIELGCICRHLEYDQYPELHTYFIFEKM